MAVENLTRSIYTGDVLKSLLSAPSLNHFRVTLRERAPQSAAFTFSPDWNVAIILAALTQACISCFDVPVVANLVYVLATIFLMWLVGRFFRSGPALLRRLFAGINFPEILPLSRVFPAEKRLHPSYAHSAPVSVHTDPGRPLILRI